MTDLNYSTLPDDFLESIADNGLDALPDAFRLLLNAAMLLERQKHLQARPYERTESLVPPPGGTQATRDLASAPNSSYGNVEGSFNSGLMAQAGGPYGYFSDKDYNISANIGSRSIKIAYDWVPNTTYNYSTGVVGPDPNDLPPDEIYAALVYTLSGSSSAEGSYSYSYATYPNVTLFNGSATASGSVTVDGHTLTIPTASSQYPAPADSQTATATYDRSEPLDFSSGHAELNITVSATAMVQGTRASKASITTNGNISASAVWLDSPNPKVDPKNPHATAARDNEDNEYFFNSEVDSAGTPTGKERVIVGCVARVAKPNKASLVLQRFQVKFLAQGFAPTFDGPSADDQGGYITDSGRYGPLPMTNGWFNGTFKIQLSVKGQTSDKNTATIQLFFDKSNTKNPGPKNAVKIDPNTWVVTDNESVPENWFFYWNQTGAGGADVYYHNGTIVTPNLTVENGGCCPSMMFWYKWMTSTNPNLSGNVAKYMNKVWIYDASAADYSRRDQKDANGNDLNGQHVSGIDMFANVVLHERRHVKQMQDVATLFPGGWSWNTPPNSPLYNHGLNDTDQDDLPNQLDTNPNSSAIGVEWQAQKAENLAEDTYADVDWSYPGKRHGDQKDGAGNRYDD